MPAITLKSLPPEVHRRLKARAARNGRSLNREALACLTAAVSPQSVHAEASLARLRELRARVRGRLTDAALARMKGRGRR